VVSFDFELLWGVHDRYLADGSAYRRNLLGVCHAVPRMLDLFRNLGIAVTWATVGAHSYAVEPGQTRMGLAVDRSYPDNPPRWLYSGSPSGRSIALARQAGRRPDRFRGHRIPQKLWSVAVDHGIYRLWWHLHNFGMHLEQNILHGVLQDFAGCSERRGMRSLSMAEVAGMALAQRGRPVASGGP
jgi:hypothetical protein